MNEFKFLGCSRHFPPNLLKYFAGYVKIDTQFKKINIQFSYA